MNRYNYSDYDPDRYGRDDLYDRDERVPVNAQPARRRASSTSRDYADRQGGSRYDRYNNRDDESNRRNEGDKRGRSQNETRQNPQRGHQPKSPSAITRFVDFLTSMRTRIVAGIAIILLCCWLSIAALSFLRANDNDQSKVTSLTTEQIIDEEINISNTAGPVGAKVSHHLFVEGLGFGSIVLIIYLVIISLALLGVKKIKFWKLTFKMLMLAISISMVLGLIFINSSATIPPGGYHGRYINVLLISHIGWLGAMLVNALLVAITVTLYINELMGLYRRYQIKMRNLRDRRQRAEDQRLEKERAVAEALADTPLSNDGEVDQPEDENDEVAENFEEPQINGLPQLEDPENYRITIGDPDAQPTFEPESNHRHQNSEIGGNEIDGASSASSLTAASGSDTDKSESNQETTAQPATMATEQMRVAAQGPGFEISEEREIEQGSGLPEQVAAQGPYDPKAELSRFRMPSIDLLTDRPRKTVSADISEQEENKERITRTLEQYNVKIDKIKATVGPTVTLYEIIPAEGVRIATIKRLEDDIAMSLAALGIRIIAPIPGKGTIGIEVPNKEPQTVSIRSILGSKAFQETKMELPMALGATISNDVFIADLAKMPHLLVAGATGQGKSVGLNTIIASLLYKRHPSELKFVLVDPKMVEFSLYACLEKHYLAKLPDDEEPVVTDPHKVVATLKSLCQEMDDRYALLKDAGCRSLIEYNERFINRRLNPEHGHRYMPYIVMIVDEFSDLIMMAGKEVETPIARIAQKARAVGMHMIIATQRPSTNVITGIIKANFPGRIGFRVSQMVDSRTILDAPGANQLIGRGDMLISSNGTMERVQCAFIDTDEVDAICKHISNQIGFATAYMLPEVEDDGDDKGSAGTPSLAELDPLLEDVGRWIVQGNTASTSSVQRRYSIGYNRAGKIMDQLERFGVVDKAQGGKPRRVLVDPMMLEDILMQIRKSSNF